MLLVEEDDSFLLHQVGDGDKAWSASGSAIVWPDSRLTKHSTDPDGLVVGVFGLAIRLFWGSERQQLEVFICL